MEILNSHHPSITVKAELSSESMHFLDTVVYKGNRFKETGTLDTKVYFKPTDTLELLHKKSHHPNHTFKGLIKSQILRYVRICNLLFSLRVTTSTLNTNFRHIICAHTPRRAMLQERSERCPHEEGVITSKM